MGALDLNAPRQRDAPTRSIGVRDFTQLRELSPNEMRQINMEKSYGIISMIYHCKRNLDNEDSRGCN